MLFVNSCLLTCDIRFVNSCPVFVMVMMKFIGQSHVILQCPVLFNRYKLIYLHLVGT